MTEAQKRAKGMVEMTKQRMGYADVPEMPCGPSRRSTRRSTDKTDWTGGSRYRSPLSARSTARSPHDFSVSRMPVHKEVAPKECFRVPSISFCAAVVFALLLAVLLASAAMFMHFVIFTWRFQDMEVKGCGYRVGSRRTLIQELVFEDVTTQQFESRLAEVASNIEHWVLFPANRALDAVWGHMVTEHTADTSWIGTQEASRRELAYRMWVEMIRPFIANAPSKTDNVLERGQRLSSIVVSFEGGHRAGYSVNCRFRPGACTTGLIWDSGGVQPNGISRVTYYESVLADGERGEEALSENWSPRGDPAIAVQRKLADERLGRAAKIERAWTKAHKLSHGEGFALSRTTPISYCGRYTCLQGAVSASINLADVTYHCRNAWVKLKRSLSDAITPFELSPANSGVFVVNQIAFAEPSQQGLLLAASDRDALAEDSLGQAGDSSSNMVKLASRALLARYGRFDHPVLMEQVNSTAALSNTYGKDGHIEWDSLAPFNFSKREAMRSPPLYAACSDYKSEDFLDQDLDDHEDCYRVGATSIKLDNMSRWLVVLVLPADAFGAVSRSKREEVDQDFDKLTSDLVEKQSEAITSGAAVVLGAALFAILLGSVLGVRVSKPLAHLAGLLEDLKNVDFNRVNPEVAKLQRVRRSNIRDVRDLQDAFCKLSRGTEAFARFVPETVVRNIIHDRQTADLHLVRRRVTILNSDIEGFTAISEKLRLDDLLLVLWRYLSVMTHIIEICEGVVSEIQGDGLVVFWNTPDTVEHHASKACCAALAQQHAVGLLHLEFSECVERWNSQPLNVRIGVHTGDVMSGHIGSNSKMKFGCLGEPLKIAADLQESCKGYGAKVLISADCHGELNDKFGLLCRRLAGDSQDKASCFYEVIGRESPAVQQDDLWESASQPSGPALAQRRPKDSSASLSTSFMVKHGMTTRSGSLVPESVPCWGTLRDFFRWPARGEKPEAEQDCGLTASAKVAYANRLRARSGEIPDTGAVATAAQLTMRVDGISASVDELLTQGSVDHITSDMVRQRSVMEEAVDAFNEGRLEIAKALAEDLIGDEAAEALVERIKTARSCSSSSQRSSNLQVL